MIGLNDRLQTIHPDLICTTGPSFPSIIHIVTHKVDPSSARRNLRK